MKKFLIRVFSLGLFLFMYGMARAADPVLYFSDLTSGPKTELGDGLGSGAIVTIWGANLGSSQGTSKVYVGGVEAAYVYEWTNATQHAGHPADLYTYHRMQVVSFSVPATAPDGPTTIKVAVNGVDSNTLPFTVRTGKIYYIKTTGNDSTGNGSWSNPWGSPDFFTKSAGNGAAAAGSIVYVLAGTWTNPLTVGLNRSLKGTAGNPYAIVAYPGNAVVVNSNQTWNVSSDNNDDSHWVVSKFKLTSKTNIVGSIEYARYIGLEITDHPTFACEPGQTGGFLSGGNGVIRNDGIIGYGIYIHDYCKGLTDSQQHTTYFSNRTGTAIAPFEFAWSYLSNNMADHGIHVYDEGAAGGWTGTVKIHDNVVVSQRGIGLGIGPGGADGYSPPITTTFEVYNNLIIDSGRGPYFLSNGGLWSVAVAFGSNTFLSHTLSQYNIKFYNNTIYGVGETERNIGQNSSRGMIHLNDFYGSLDMRNNIFVDTKNWPWTVSGNTHFPEIHSNNVWYNGGDGNPANPPTWDTTPLKTDPLFINPTLGDFTLQSNSPAISAGISLVSPRMRDLRGKVRPLIYSIGALEYSGAPSPPQNLRLLN